MPSNQSTLTKGRNASGGPTQTEGMLFFYVIKHLKSKPEVDWEAVAGEAGFKNGDVAKVRHLLLSANTTETTVIHFHSGI